MNFASLARSGKSFCERNRALLLAAGLSLLILGVFAQVADFEFIHLDDDCFIWKNPRVAKGLTRESFRWAFNADFQDNDKNCDFWRPLSLLSHILDIQYFGLNPRAHHLVNLGLHLANTLLLFGLLRAWTGCDRKSAFAAAVFAVHPLQAETVAWVSARKDLLSVFFALLALRTYTAYSKKPQAVRALPVVFFFVCSLLSKSMMVTLPVLMLLLDRWPLGRFDSPLADRKQFVRLAAEKWPLYLASAFSSFVTIRVLGPEAEPSTFFVKLSQSLVNYVFYIYKFVFPFRLSAWYDFPGVDRFTPARPVWEPLGAGFVLAALALWILMQARRRPYVLTACLWFFIALLPVISLRMRIRGMYFPIIGPAVLLAWGAGELAKRLPSLKKGLTPAGVCLVIFWALACFSAARYWQNSISIFGRATALYPGAAVPYAILGNALNDQGKTKEAAAQYELALKADPMFHQIHNNLSNMLRGEKRFAEAREHLLEAVRINPVFGDAYFNLGSLMREQGKAEEAILPFMAALRTNPNNLVYYWNACSAFYNAGFYDAAAACFKDALRLAPGDPDLLDGLDRSKKQLGTAQDAPSPAGG